MDYKFIVKEIEGDKVLLKDEAGEEFVWPKFKLPDGVVIGQEVFFKISLKEFKELDPEAVLEEILNIE